METTPELPAAQSGLRAVAHGGPLKDPRVLGATAQALIAVQALVQIVLSVTSHSGTQVFLLAAYLEEPSFIAGAVVFLMWFWRCRLNAEAFAPGRHTYGPGLSLLSWFVPGLMWWVPWRAMLDICRAVGDDRGVRLINAWWIGWLVEFGGMLTYLVLDPDGNPNAPWVALVDSVVAVLAIAVIRRITTAQSDVFGSRATR